MHVVGTAKVQIVEREWQLVAERGEGPFIPCTVVRALARKLTGIAPGARACVAELSLAEIEATMIDLSVRTAIQEQVITPLFQAALGDAWGKLPEPVQRLHLVAGTSCWTGTASVERGTSLVAPLAAWFIGFPKTGADIPVTVTMSRTSAGETWTRNFAGRRFRSYLSHSPKPGHFRERFWLMTFEIAFPVDGETLSFQVKRGWFWRIPLSSWLLPGSDSREFSADGKFCFDVGLSAPFGGALIVRYQGWLKPVP